MKSPLKPYCLANSDHELLLPLFWTIELSQVFKALSTLVSSCSIPATKEANLLIPSSVTAFNLTKASILLNTWSSAEVMSCKKLTVEYWLLKTSSNKALSPKLSTNLS